jgi:hypothetical protein
MPRLLGLWSALAAMLLAAIPARADVSWGFIVTSTVNLGCPSCPPPSLPVTGGFLTVSDAAFLRGSLSYSHVVLEPDEPNVVITGDTDFQLSLGSDTELPISPLRLGSGNGLVGLSFSSNGEISGHIENAISSGGLSMDISSGGIVAHSFLHSDGWIPGCGDFTQCFIDGYWQLTSSLPQRIPEPSPLSILLCAITGLGIMRWRAVLKAEFCVAAGSGCRIIAFRKG